MPKQAQWKLDPDAAYVHITSNETIGGVEFHWTPDTGDVPLVADASSHILSRPMDVSRYGLIYAGRAEEHRAGRPDDRDRARRSDRPGAPITPSVFDYKMQADNDSMYNTPPTYGIYIAGLVFQWLKKLGGARENGRDQHREGEARLRLPRSDRVLSLARSRKEDRSRMNIPFTLRNAALDKAFLAEAEAHA